MKNSILAACVSTAVVFCLPLYGQDSTESAPSKDRVAGFCSFSTLYNDNILDYSDEDLSKFYNLHHLIESGELPARDTAKFAIDHPFATALVVKSRVTFFPVVFENNPTSIRAKFSRNFYTSSSLRNYSSFGLELQQTLFRRNTLSVGWNYLPSLYLRNYLYLHLRRADRLKTQYIQASFSRMTWSGELEHTFTRRISAAVSYDHEQEDFNDEFVERDNTTHKLSVNSDFKLLPYIKLGCGYTYAASWANGRDLTDSLSDVSYRSHRIAIDATFLLRPLLKIPVNIHFVGSTENEDFLSDKVYDQFTKPSGDKFHYGRVDHYRKLSGEITYEISKMFDVFIQYYWEQNVTNMEETRDIGSFQTHQIGAGVEISL